MTTRYLSNLSLNQILYIENRGRERNTYLKSSGQEFIFYFKEVSFAYIHLKRFIDYGKPNIILDVLPATIAVSYDASQQPIIMPARKSKIKAITDYTTPMVAITLNK